MVGAGIRIFHPLPVFHRRVCLNLRVLTARRVHLVFAASDVAVDQTCFRLALVLDHLVPGALNTPHRTLKGLGSDTAHAGKQTFVSSGGGRGRASI